MNLKLLNFLIRLILTTMLVAWAALPIINNQTSDSVLGEVLKFGLFPTIATGVAFFIMVAFYCRSLQRCLTLIQPKNRKATPASVWYMFAIPFNFVEDFFIVIDVANSIEEEKKTNSKLSMITDFGMVSGIGWSIAQIMSFIPNIIGQMAGLIGMVLVIYHWILISRINKILSTS